MIDLPKIRLENFEKVREQYGTAAELARALERSPQQNKLLPIMIMHYHPDHKGIHILVPCNTDPQRDFTSRELPGAPELNLYPGIAPDIRTDEGVCKLIELFCQAAGITISGKRFVQGSLF